MTFDHSHDLVWRQSKSDTTEHATLDRTVTALLTRLGINLADFLDMPLFDILHLHATRTPDALAVVGPDTKLNWTTLVSHVRGLGAAIAARVPPGHSVAVLLPDGPEALVGILACAAAARMAHILNAGHPPARNAMILAHTGAAAILTHKIPAGLELPARITVIPPDANQKDEALPPAMPQNAPAFVIYTSGSTGRPKGIVLSQGVTIYRAMTNFITDTPDLPNRMMSLFALSSISGFHSSFSALVCGGCAILPAGTSPIPMMLAEKPTTLVGLPAFLRTLMISPDAPLALASLRLMRAGGEAVLGSDIADWYRHLPASCRIQTGYGQTEAAVLMWLAPRDYSDPGPIPLGIPRPGMEYVLLDEDGRPVPDGEAGILYVRNAYVALGEWENGHCVFNRIQPDPEDPTRRRLNTGDLLAIRPDGMFNFKGRADRQIKVRGLRIDPGEIEAALHRVPGVAEAAVIARAGHNDTELLGFIVASAQDAAKARAHLKTILPPQMWPRRVIALPALPRLPDGKINRLALLALPETNGLSTSRPAKMADRWMTRARHWLSLGRKPGKPSPCRG